MVFKLTSTQISQINTWATAGEYYLAYSNLADWADGGDGVDPNSIAWLRGASLVNEGSGPFSAFIRNYTNHQYELRYGTSLGSTELQILSNTIASNVITEILSNHSNAGIADIPVLANIGNHDASGTVGIDFHGDTTAWSGVVLFPFLGNDTYLNDMLHTTDTTSTYDALAAIGSLQVASGAAVIDGLDDLSSAVSSFYTAGSPFSSGMAATIAEDLSGFVSEAYGITEATALIGKAVLGKLDTGDGHGLNDTITSDPDTLELIHAGAGNDTIIASHIGDVGDVVDGGDGRDIFDFSAGTFEMNVTSDSDSYTNDRLLLDARFLPIDYTPLVNIEELRLGSDNDHVHVNLNAASTLDTLTTGDGDDDVNITLMPYVSPASHSLLQVVDTGEGDDTVNITGGADPSLFVYLGSGDDTLISTVAGSEVYGDAGADTFYLGKDYRIDDASSEDHISWMGKNLTGGIRWSDSDSPWAEGVNGVRYGRNSDGELIIRDLLGNDTYVANFDFDTSSPFTAGIL